MNCFKLLISILFCSSIALQAQQEKLIQKFESIGEEMNSAVLAGDYEKVMSFFADDVMIFPVLEPQIKGKKAYREAVKRMLKKGVKYKSLSGTTTEIWECGDMVYQIGTFGMSLIYNESPRPVAYYGSFFQVWIKVEDGSYKLKYMMSNLDFNPFEK